MRAIQRRLFATVFAILCAVLVVGLVSGCGTQNSASPPSAGNVPQGGGEPEPDPGSPTVTLTAPSPATVTAGAGGATIQVTVLDADGAPLAGETVLFRATPSSVASLSAATAVTDANGRAAIGLAGLRAGVASITASFGGVTSSAAAFTVLAPNVSIAAAANQITASVQGVGGTVVTATVTDQNGTGIDGLTVTMRSSLGTLTSVIALGGGQYQATLTSTQVGIADVSATALSTTSETASVSVMVGALTNFVLTPSPSQIVLGGTSTLSVTAQDALGNAISGTIDFTLATVPADIATLSEAHVALVDGEASVILTGVEPGTASVTASITIGDDTTSETEEVAIVEDLNGVPALVSIAVDPAEITVGDETSTVTVTITDIFGAPIVDVPNNVELEIIAGPFGVDLGGKSVGEVLLASSSQGIVSVPLVSGKLPGTVKIEARVVRKMGPAVIEPILITPAEPAKILIQSGPPFSLFLGRSTVVTNNRDGTYTQQFFATVSDQFGNAVRDGTSVYMGQFINILALGVNGIVDLNADASAVQAGDAVSLTIPGTFSGVAKDDTIAILSGANRGGYLIETVAEGGSQVGTRTQFMFNDTAVDYAAGNNGGDGGPVLDTGPESFTVSGKALWQNTYPVEQINEPLVVHGETQGRTVTSARLFQLGYIENSLIQVFGPTTAAAGDALDFQVLVRDGGSPRTPIGGLGVAISVDIPAGDVGLGEGDFNDGTGNNGLNAITVFTGRYSDTDYGMASFIWNVPSTAVVGDSFTLTFLGADGNASHSISVE